jgi:hypothetical protein
VSRRRLTPSDPTARLALREEELVKRVLDTLKPTERAVLDARFGLTDGRPMALDEIGKKYGVSRERIRQIVSKGLSALRHPARATVLWVPDGGFVDVAPRTDVPSPDDDFYVVVNCPHCQRRFMPKNHDGIGGRPRKYCSDECRLAYYRARRVRGPKPRNKSSKQPRGTTEQP